MRELRDLVKITKSHDYREFKEFIRSEYDMANVHEDEEMVFFNDVPKHWQKAYLKVTWPMPRTERLLMNIASQDVLEYSYQKWGFLPGNVVLTFYNAPLQRALMVLKCLKEHPGAEAELAMVRRNNVNLLKAWLEKYHSLSEDSERYLEEHPEVQSLKSEYVNYTLMRQAEQL